MRLYISGPMSGIKDLNYPEFQEWAEKLRKVGYAVVNPAENDFGSINKPREFYLRNDILALLTVDGVALLDGWTKSKGAQLEAQIAKEVNLTCRSAQAWYDRALDASLGAQQPSSSITEPLTPTPTHRPGWTKQDADAFLRAEAVETGIKHDDDKSRMDLISPTVMDALGKVLAHGAEKYAARNWEKGVDFSRYYGAALRHMTAWWNGCEKDTDSGLHPLWHALCSLMFLVHYTTPQEGPDFVDPKYDEHDDRP